jgi:hypothetical protein
MDTLSKIHGQIGRISFPIFENVYAPLWWCDDCDPYQMGAREGKLSSIKTYQDAILLHLQFRTPKGFLKDLVKIIAIGKGLPRRVGQKDAEEIFGSW